MVFSGIVEELGTVTAFDHRSDLMLWDGSQGEGYVLLVACPLAHSEATIGCSVCIEGTCLTVTAILPDDQLEFNLAPETLRRTNFTDRRPGDKVNVERALSVTGGRNSGHNVQGHVDGTATVASRRRDGEALWVTLATPADMLKYIVPKGFIAIDGTSLTVCEVDRQQQTFSIMLVVHTQKSATLPLRKEGERVNIEVDVLAKYVEAAVGDRLAALEAAVFPSDRAIKAGATVNQGHKEAVVEAIAAPVDQHGEIKAIREQLGQRTVHGKGLQVPLPHTIEAKSFRIGVVRTCWHEKLISVMEKKCISALVGGGVEKCNILRAVVPGSFELPFVADLFAGQNVDVVICIGILLKGGTIHMEVIADSVARALMDVQLKRQVPIIFGVLTVLSMEQAEERAYSDLGHSWGQAALNMAMHRRQKGFCTTADQDPTL